MNKSININAALMLLCSIAFTYFTVGLIVPNEGLVAYTWGFIFGRSIAAVLLPLFIVWLIRTIARRKPMFTKGAFITWWLLFVVLSFFSLVGSMLPPVA